MRQIFSLHERFESIGDYAWLTNSNRMLVLAFRYCDTHWGFYSDSDIGFDGSVLPRCEKVTRCYPFLRVFGYSWAIPVSDTLAEGIADLSTVIGYDLALDTTPRDVSFLSPIPSVEEGSDMTPEVSDFFHGGYEMERVYSGIHQYHHHHEEYLNKALGDWRGYRFGIELEVEFNDRETMDIFRDIESNWFYRERDGSLGSYGCEIISVPLLPQHAKDVVFWSGLTDYLHGRATSWNTGTCGLHVHVSREILGENENTIQENLGKLLFVYHNHIKDTRLNVRIFGREHGYNDTDGKTDITKAAKIFGSEVLKLQSVRAKVKCSAISHSERGRYFDINIRNTHTIEFRKGRGSINPNRIAMVVSYCEILCQYAKETPWQQLSYDDFVRYLKVHVKNDDLRDVVKNNA